MDDRTTKKSADVQLVKVVGITTTRFESALAASFRHTTIGTALTAICGENKNRNKLHLKNLSSDTVWIGDRQLIPGTTGTGWPLITKEVLELENNIGEIWAATEANSSILAIVEE